MKNDNFMKDFHLGSMLKEVARQKRVTSRQMAEVISHYRQHPDKIFKLKDMDVEYVIKISYLLKANLLWVLCQKYKSYLPDTDSNLYGENFHFVLNMKTNHIKPDNNEICDFLEKIDVGKYIETFAEKNNWTQQDVADKLGYSQSTVSNMYRSKSIKMKRLFYISSVLQHHFISEVYLSQTRISLSGNKFDDCIFSVNEKEINIKKPGDKSFSMKYRRHNDGDF